MYNCIVHKKKNLNNALSNIHKLRNEQLTLCTATLYTSINTTTFTLPATVAPKNSLIIFTKKAIAFSVLPIAITPWILSMLVKVVIIILISRSITPGGIAIPTANLSSVERSQAEKDDGEDNPRSISSLLLPILIVFGGSVVECKISHDIIVVDQ